MTIITPLLPTVDQSCYVVLGNVVGETVFAMCDHPGCKRQVFGTHDDFLAHVETIHELGNAKAYAFHHGCAARLLADMFDHFCGSTNGCPFCGAEWQTYSERDGSVFIEHHDHCLYEALMDAITVLDDEDLRP